MIQNIHIIQKLLYEIKTRQQKTAIDIQNKLQDINTSYVLPQIASKMDKLFPDKEVVTIEKMEIDLGRIRSTLDDDDWASLIVEKLDEQLQIIGSTDNAVPNRQRSKHLIESWIWFLKNGILPAGSIYNSANEMMQEFKTGISNEKFTRNEIEEIRHFIVENVNDHVITRLAGFDPRIQKAHLQIFLSSKFEKDIDELDSQIERIIINKKRQLFFQDWSISFLRQNILKDVFKKIISKNDVGIISIKQMVNESLLKLEDENNFNDRVIDERVFVKTEIEREMQFDKLITDHEIFISNAGLCLLTPWLSSFFRKTGLVVENRFIDEWRQQHAVYLLHFLVTNETNPEEELLVLPKLICGWPVQIPVVNPNEFTEHERNECSDLLRSVIQNWPILKNTSIEGLQKSFLQRQGKLTGYEDRFVIQPEQQSIDILLEHVPWTFRYFRLPWMKKPVQIDWY